MVLLYKLTCSMWIHIVLTLILINPSEEICTKIRTFKRRLYIYMSCTKITPSYNLNRDILAKMDYSIEDLLVLNSSIPELNREMFLNVTFNNVTIQANVEIIQDEAFKDFNVTSLILDHNDIKKIKDKSFSSSRIEFLSLQNNSISEIKVNNFQGLSGLEKLYLKYNDITDIEEDSFSSLTNIKELDLSFNKLVELHFGLFETMTLLQTIYLNNNLLKGLSDHVFSGCKALTFLNIANNFITILDARYYPNSLFSVNASNNRLMSVDFSNLENLDNLDLNFNNLKTVTNSLYNLYALSDLYLSYNSLGPSIDTKTFHHTKNLITLNLDGNGLRNIDIQMLNNLSRLGILSLAANSLTNLDFSNLNIPLRTLILGKNSLSEIRNLSNMHNLMKLDLSYNNLEEIGYDTFGTMTILSQLWLQHNSIRLLHLGCFRNLHLLRDLNLSHNRIINLEVGLFTGLSGLAILDISYNNISHLDENIFHSTKHLAFLNISYNHLSDLEARNIRTHTFWLREITLFGNNWTCKRLIDNFKGNTPLTHGTSFNVTNVFGIPCTNTNNSSQQANQTDDSVNLSKYLDSVKAFEKEISSKMTVIVVVLIILSLLICMKFALPKCSSCFNEAKQFFYTRHRDEQEIQL
ncbi:protein artichoke-like [Anoplophora glabripennis]|uniref:protein artichoke-like n=1 Tax=Anoplophora glabripennis TaxID=217634 RepID=UPI000874BF6E|nr:protein artichoke-like [Anoplophora glabripennis]